MTTLRLILLSLVMTVGCAVEGQLSTAQPFFLQSAAVDPCAYFAGPIDEFTNYTALVSLDGLNGGCHWNGAFVAHTYENIPAVWLQDTYNDYTAGVILDGVGGGIAWFSLYVLHSYETLPILRYVDAFSEYSANDSMVANTLGGGTNYFASYTTNIISTQAWTNGPYVGKGY